MAVDTRKVRGRRKVRYESFEDLVAEAEIMAAADEVTSLGNWSVGQTLKHLGASMEGSINGTGFEVPLFLRIIGRIYIKRLLLNGPFPTGFQLPKLAAKRLVPDPTTPSEGLAALRRGLECLSAETKRAAHPVAGPLTVAEWDRFHLRHAEMHMSFLVPGAKLANAEARAVRRARCHGP